MTDLPEPDRIGIARAAIDRKLCEANLDPEGLSVERRVDGIRLPWRIVTSDGSEVNWEIVMFEHSLLGPMPMVAHGYESKRKAKAGLARLRDKIGELNA